jgi:DNA-binding transcriptional regulator LsrR (DeoR family)
LPTLKRNWPRYARALDLYLMGFTQKQIGDHFGVTRQRAAQIIFDARRQLAFRVFRGIRRPRPSDRKR